jgi:hypothetical protein
MLAFNPAGYAGGRWDDGRYLEIAQAWLAHGPQLGHTHWSLRWPVFVDAMASLKLWGPDRLGLMLFPFLGWLATAAILYAMTLRRWGYVAAAIASFAFITTPEILLGATRISADVRELLFWTASMWCFVSACENNTRGVTLRLVAAGFLASLAFATRETAASLLIVFGLAFLSGKFLPRQQFLWIAAGFLPLFLAEHVLLYLWSGHPLWRFRVDMNHVNVASTMMEGMVAKSQDPVADFAIAQRWLNPGPINLWWPVNPFLNLFVRVEYGLLFSVTAVMAIVARATRMKNVPWRLIGVMLIVAAIQMVLNIFVLVTDPQPRMFLPTIYLTCLALGLLCEAAFDNGLGAVTLPLFPLLLAGGLWGMDETDNFAGVEHAAEQVLHVTPEPVFAERYSRSHLALVRRPEADRLRVGTAPLGGLQIVVQRPIWPNDTINEDLSLLPTGQCWIQVRALHAGRPHVLFTLVNIAAFEDRKIAKLVPPFKVGLYRHEAGNACRGWTRLDTMSSF